MRTSYPLSLSASQTSSSKGLSNQSTLPSIGPSCSDLRISLARSGLLSLTALAYLRYFLRILGPSFLADSTCRSSGSNDSTTLIFLLARLIATFRRFSPPFWFSQPNLCTSLPLGPLAYPMENTISSLSSPWTFSMFLTNSPMSSPSSLFLFLSASMAAAKAGSLAHSSSRRCQLQDI